jgi:hypothetical protein
MAAIDFPSNPDINDTHSVNGKIWSWDGEKWIKDTQEVSNKINYIEVSLVMQTF